MKNFNPFDSIENRLSVIEEILVDIKHKALNSINPRSNFSDIPEFLTRQQAAKMLSVSLGTLDTWAKEGRITKHRAGGVVRFRKDELLANFKSLKESKFQRF